MASISQSDKVYDYILERIQNGEWQTGDKILSENALGDALEVSRIAIREALEKFSALGILEKRQGAGTFVSKIDIMSIISNIVPVMTLMPMDLLDVQRFRLHFETGNIIEFMKYHDPIHLERLKETYKTMKFHSHDSDEFYIADNEFHKIIAEGTKNQIIISINEMMEGILKNSQRQTNIKVGPEIGLEYHGIIIMAIESDDQELASLLMMRHIEATIKSISESL